MKTKLFFLIAFISLPLISIGQNKETAIHNITAVSKDRDSLGILTGGVGDKIFDIWMSKYHYVKKIKTIPVGQDAVEFVYWETGETNTPKIIFRVDEISVKPGAGSPSDSNSGIVQF